MRPTQTAHCSYPLRMCDDNRFHAVTTLMKSAFILFNKADSIVITRRPHKHHRIERDENV